jgi:hypothetical protein
MISYGFYTPRYEFANAEGYKSKLEEIREKQKHAIQSHVAIICTRQWTVDGSKSKGTAMTNRIIKLGLNAFNVQCDNTILKVSHSNVKASEERLVKVKQNIDKLLIPNHCNVDEAFFKLKLDELYLAYEYEQKLQMEKDEQRQVREQMREEAKVQQELERAKTEAERDRKAIEKAKKELESKSEEERVAYQAKITELEVKLADKERKISQAQLTKSGHVYVISNVGSFGEKIFKIGLTRRLEPMERVWELSDAALPFEFDVHAMIHSDNAPELERKLHEYFSKKRVNRVNERKEFFEVSVDEIELQCRQLGIEIEFVKLADAKEYRQTLAMISAESEQPNKPSDDILSRLKAIKGKAA